MSDRLGEGVQYGSHPCRVAAAERPGGLFVDVAVGLADHPPDRLERDMKRLLPDMLTYGSQETARRIQQGFVGRRKLGRLRHAGSAIAVDHDQYALGQISEIIGEVA